MIIHNKYQLSELTGKIIGCAMEVHRIMGNGFQEVVYQRCMAIEMANQGIEFSREHEMDLIYKGKNVGTRRAGFFVEGQIMLELKTVAQLENVHLDQAINYLEAYGLDIGLLINFGNISLQFKRVMKPQKIKVQTKKIVVLFLYRGRPIVSAKHYFPNKLAIQEKSYHLFLHIPRLKLFFIFHNFTNSLRFLNFQAIERFFFKLRIKKSYYY